MDEEKQDKFVDGEDFSFGLKIELNEDSSWDIIIQDKSDGQEYVFLINAEATVEISTQTAWRAFNYQTKLKTEIAEMIEETE